jgi:ADP-heptose:LPS heptosyltransferase
MVSLLAGPWVGEFGWELFCWQAYIRAISDIVKPTNMVAVTRPGRELLYSDFCDTKAVDIPVNSAECSWCNGFNIQKATEELVKEYPGYAVINPFTARYYGNPINLMMFGKPIELKPRFVKLGPDPIETYPIILHARMRERRNDDNWSAHNWQDIGNYLSNKGWSFASIGSLEESINVPGGKDLRGLSLSESVNYLSGAKVIAGPSSGAIHLASLCGCPQLVWSGADNNKSRYETEWNPFNTKVSYIGNDLGGWHPSVDNVLRELESFL